MYDSIEPLVKEFLDCPNENNSCNLVRTLRCSNLHSMNVLIGNYLFGLYPHNLDIISETAISAYYSNNYKLSYDLYSKILQSRILDEKQSSFYIFNRHFSTNHIINNYIDYPSLIVEQILKNPINPTPLVTFTITSCKRFNLFEKTINSFLNCCEDIKKIDTWLCIDDNSCEQDRIKMKEKYPFFTFYFKKIEEKGHPQSMNIIRNLVKTPYIFHIEDDWQFFEKKHFISECIEVLGSDNKIGQCLINKNYAEVVDDIHIEGGFFNKTPNGLRYFIHEYTPDEKSQIEFNSKHKNAKHCSYWSHFSFRPSLLKKSVLDIIGEYNQNISHFELEYSQRYVNNGYVSAFLESIYCLHIGRLTSQRFDKSIPNAYELNNEFQFADKELNIHCPSEKNEIDNIKSFVINLDRRSDRLRSFNDNMPIIKYSRFSAIDGSLLKPNKQLQKIFEGNDYNMRVGLVGCAMSHIKLLIELSNSQDDSDKFFILEDDVRFVPKFLEKFNNILIELENINWDFIYLGHHLYPRYKTDDCYDKEQPIQLIKTSSSLSLIKSMGGFFAYLVNKKGAIKLLEFINKTGMTNAIDTMQQKAITEANMDTFYCYPHMVYSECVLPDVQINSDIQYNFNSLSMNEDQLIEKYEGERLKKNGVFNVDDALIFK
jgi:GR25 family glycosyltransferase involved in LPS biosynthesis